MRILLAGPGTGKTTNIGKIITTHGDGSKFLVLSFTQATVRDLQKSLKEQSITDDNCMTLHKFAVKYNHDRSRHVLLDKEVDELKTISKGTEIEFDKLCDFFNCTTFDQMISRFVEYAKSNPLYLKEKLAGYDSLIVDEYQDFNPYEQSLIDILLENIQNVFLMGDDDQCIYDFKDASSDKIISFYNDTNNERVSHEDVCYRCPDKIVEHASNLIKENQKRVDKRWIKHGNPGEVEYSQLRTLNEIADTIYSEIIKIKNESVLILTPVKFAIKPLLIKFVENKVEFTDYTAKKVPDALVAKSWEVKSLFGLHKYLNLVLVGYLVLKERSKFYKLLKKHFDSGKNYDELTALIGDKIPVPIKSNQKNLDELLSEEYFSEIKKLYSSAKGTTSDDKLENIFREVEELEENNIKIMSIYKSKGLGADNVFIVGLNEGILPNRQKGNDTLESQRRLFYVGVTRTKKQLHLYSNIYTEGKDIFANKLNEGDFRYDPHSKMYKGKALTFISELKLL